MLGLKLNKIELFDHQIEWDKNAESIIQRLKTLFNDTTIDIQHVGSTAIRHIKAKPIIDIAVGVKSFDVLPEVSPRLEKNDICESLRHDDDIMYVIDAGNGTRTHNIHIVVYDSDKWRSYINLRDYLNAHPEKARAYESVKVELAKQYPNDLSGYTHGKEAFITECLVEARLFAERV